MSIPGVQKKKEEIRMQCWDREEREVRMRMCVCM